MTQLQVLAQPNPHHRAPRSEVLERCPGLELKHQGSIGETAPHWALAAVKMTLHLASQLSRSRTMMFFP